jgi:hypothetical protein
VHGLHTTGLQHPSVHMQGTSRYVGSPAGPSVLRSRHTWSTAKSVSAVAHLSGCKECGDHYCAQHIGNHCPHQPRAKGGALACRYMVVQSVTSADQLNKWNDCEALPRIR